MMEVIVSSETLVSTFKITWHNPEDHKPYLKKNNCALVTCIKCLNKLLKIIYLFFSRLSQLFCPLIVSLFNELHNKYKCPWWFSGLTGHVDLQKQ
jgi:hypothetical protein